MPMKIEKTGERDTSTRTLVVYGELTGLEPRVKAYTTTKRYRPTNISVVYKIPKGWTTDVPTITLSGPRLIKSGDSTETVRDEIASYTYKRNPLPPEIVEFVEANTPDWYRDAPDVRSQ
jgi:hypothetical protein